MGCNSLKSNKYSKHTDLKIDSLFQTSFTFLNDVLKDSSSIEGENSYKKFNNTINFLEGITGISSQREGTFVGLIYRDFAFLKIDLDKWKQWYNENKNRLRWDSENEKIILK